MKREKNYRLRERGFSLIELMIVIAIIGILVGVGVPAWKSSVIAGNETAAINTLLNIAKEQRTYYTRKGEYGTFAQLVASGALDSRFNTDVPAMSGYNYTMKVTPKAPNQPASFTINADPQQGGIASPTGERHFYIDSGSSTVHFKDDQPAGPDDPIPGS